MGAPLEVLPGPVKAKTRAWDKVANWPPAFAELTDLCRATVLCSDPFQLAVFVAALDARFGLVRVANRFFQWDSDPAAPAVYRNVNTNVWFKPPGGQRVIVEVQLH